MALRALQDKETIFAKKFALPYAATPLNACRTLIAPETTDEETALWIAAPCLAAFALWAKKEAEKHETPRFLGVMREGRFLLRLMKQLFNIEGTEIWANRSLSQRAAFGSGDREALINWLLRTPMKTLSQKEAAALLTGDEASTFSDDLLNAQNITDFLSNPLFMKSAELYNKKLALRFLKHIKKLELPAKDPLLLLDFASVGNIQRSLRTLFLSQRWEDPFIGLNFAMTEGARWARKAGAQMKGFACDDGTPAFFTRAIARTPELMEVFTGSDLGSLEDFSEEGTPVLSETFLSDEQILWLKNIQEKMLAAAEIYYKTAPEILAPALVHVLWGRLLLAPSKEEAETFGDWPLDAALDGKKARKLAPKRQDMETDKVEEWDKPQTAWPAATALRD